MERIGGALGGSRFGRGRSACRQLTFVCLLLHGVARPPRLQVRADGGGLLHAAARGQRAAGVAEEEALVARDAEEEARMNCADCDDEVWCVCL